MKTGAVVDWQKTVMPVWRDAAKHTGHYNRDVWGRLPEDVCWFHARMEPQDIALLYVIGSEDWLKEFGSYRLLDIAGSEENIGGYHREHIHEIRRNTGSAKTSAPLIVVAGDAAGPFVLLDGNHRAVALQLCGLLAGQECFLGLHQALAEDFVWYWRALGLRPG